MEKLGRSGATKENLQVGVGFQLLKLGKNEAGSLHRLLRTGCPGPSMSQAATCLSAGLAGQGQGH